MSTLIENVNRIQQAKSDIISSIESKGIEIPDNTKIDNLPDYIDSIDELKGETRTVTPTTSQQTITPTTGKNAITQVTINPVTHSIDANITESNIKSGVTILGITGNYELKGYELYDVPAQYCDSNGNLIEQESADNIRYSLKDRAINRIFIDNSDYSIIIELPRIEKEYARDYIIRLEIVTPDEIPEITIEPPAGEEFTIESIDEWSEFVKGVNIISITETYRNNNIISESENE